MGYSRPLDLAKGFFAYHGTSVQAIVPICQNGFDPKRRSGQAHGCGEYFGVAATVSHGYSQKRHGHTGSSQMIIAFILQCTQIKTVPNFCYVVNNPTDWSSALNLPVLVITYGSNPASQLSPFPNEIPDFFEGESPWNVPFRWHWRQDNGQFEPYNDRINEILEKAYEQWKLHGGSSTFVTPPLTRCIDDIPQTYQMDFANNIQTNTKTFYQRPIERRSMDDSLGEQKWFFRNEFNQWVAYESLVQKLIENQYKS